MRRSNFRNNFVALQWARKRDNFMQGDSYAETTFELKVDFRVKEF
jgi:hypothetical protein